MHSQPLDLDFPKSALGSTYEGNNYNEPVFPEMAKGGSNPTLSASFRRAKNGKLRPNQEASINC